MKIVVRKIAELRFAEYNPRKMNKKQRADIKASLKKFDFAVPIVVNVHPERKNVIIGGHQRVIVAKELKYKEVPTVEKNLTLEQERELNLRLNKNNAEWDLKKLEENFDVEELLGAGFIKNELNFDASDIVETTAKKAKKPRANVETLFQLGELRFTMPQKKYNQWRDELAKQVGMAKEKQVAEIMKRLRIDNRLKK